jgi:two-component system, OmpR family, alkaline phosphatase synthesis response regulator PhoP
MINQFKILIVDDEEDILEFLGFNLSSENYIVDKAKDGVDAIKKLESSIPDLIILDIMMPNMDGISFYKWLKTNSSLNSISVLFLTARKDEETEIAALDLGADDFINKPVKIKSLISRIKSILRRHKSRTTFQESGKILKFDKLVINPSTMDVIYNSNKLDLARKEFQLLYLLASAPGRVFRRNEILDSIWGTSIIVGDRTIDVHIRKLREKMDNSYIKTIKGVGYKFEI